MDFNPKFLPLGYILFLDPTELDSVMKTEFPDVEISEYKKEILTYLQGKGYRGYLHVLQ